MKEFLLNENEIWTHILVTEPPELEFDALDGSANTRYWEKIILGATLTLKVGNQTLPPYQLCFQVEGSEMFLGNKQIMNQKMY